MRTCVFISNTLNVSSSQNPSTFKPSTNLVAVQPGTNTIVLQKGMNPVVFLSPYEMLHDRPSIVADCSVLSTPNKFLVSPEFAPMTQAKKIYKGEWVLDTLAPPQCEFDKTTSFGLE